MRNAHVRLFFDLIGWCFSALTVASGPVLAQVPQEVEITVRELPERAKALRA